MKAVCEICPHQCVIVEGHRGFCRARENVSGKVVCANYGQLTSIALDPIEKKPLNRFMPGSNILSVGSYGCNLRCPYCQNNAISMSDGVETIYVPPKVLALKAAELVSKGNVGVAYTYNEPLISYEYVKDCALAVHAIGLNNVLVTNGYICEQPLTELLPHINAMNIDVKAFTQKFYKHIGGDLETVKSTIKQAVESCHVEVTTLIIPNENDAEEEMSTLSQWLAGIDREIPLHISRFFPRYKYSDRQPTDVNRIYRLMEVARKKLKYVYAGNC